MLDKISAHKEKGLSDDLAEMQAFLDTSSNNDKKELAFVKK